jgi:Bacterial Ig-like domain
MSNWALVATTTIKNTVLSEQSTLTGSVTIANEGDLMIVGFSAFVSGTPTFTLTDTNGNDWLLGAHLANGDVEAGFFWAQANASGSTTLTLTSSSNVFMSFTANEFALPGGTSTVTLATTATTARGSSNTTTPSTSSMTFSGDSLIYGAFGEDDNSQPSHTAGTGFTQLASFIGIGSQIIGYLDEFQVTSASPIAATATWGAAAQSAAAAGVFQVVELLRYNLTGPSSGTANVPSTNFTLTPAASTTDTVTPSDGGKGGTFTPARLTFNASGAAQTFTYTPTTTGEISLTLTSADGGVITGSPLSYTSAAPDPPPTGTGVVPELGFQFSAPITGDAVTFTVTVSATQASVPGTTTYNSGTQTATFTPTNPFLVGTKYLAVVSGATAADGTPMVPATFPFTPGSLKSTGWFAGLSRPI